MREPLLAPLAALASGVLVSRTIEFEWHILLWAHLLFLMVAAAARWLRIRGVATVILLGMLVATGALVDLLHRPEPRPVIEAEPGETILVKGCVVEPPVFYDGKEQFLIRLEPGAHARVNVYLKDGEEPPELEYGQPVDVQGRIREPRNFRNPGSFDYVAYLAKQDIYWTISVSSADGVKLLDGECGAPFDAAIFSLRTSALNRLERLVPDSPEELAMLRAMLLGESAKLERVWKDRFRRTGTYHTLVISGLHVTILAACFLFFFRMLNLGQGWTLLLTAVAAWLYAGITGWDTPVIRAASGLTLFLIGGYFARRRRLLNILAAIAIAFVLVDPDHVSDPSFHMSFLAVAMIGAVAVPVLERTSGIFASGARGLNDLDRDLHLEPRAAQMRVELRLLAETLGLWTGVKERWVLPVMGIVLRFAFYIYDLFVVSLIIQIGLALPMVVYFHRVSFAGLLANPLVVFLTTLSVPTGFLAILTGWGFAAKVAALLVGFSMRVVAWFAAWEADLRVPDPPGWLVWAFLASLVLLAITIRVLRRLQVAAVAVMAAVSGLLLAHPFKPKIWPGTLEMTALDVGQAESLFIALPDGNLMMVDGGGIPTFGKRAKPRIDIGEDVVSPYLWTRSIKRVNVLVASHSHEDHIGGLPALARNFRPQELWVGLKGAGEAWSALERECLLHGVKIVEMRQGRRFRYGGVNVEVLAPPVDYVAGVKPRNNDSLVLRLTNGEHSFLLTGDIEREIERWLVSEDLIKKSDVLKVPHHGSRTSTSQPFVDLVRPRFALISSGYLNSYGFPHPDIIERLESDGATVLRTDRDGLVGVRSDGRHLAVIPAPTPRWPSPLRPRPRDQRPGLLPESAAPGPRPAWAP